MSSAALASCALKLTETRTPPCTALNLWKASPVNHWETHPTSAWQGAGDGRVTDFGAGSAMCSNLNCDPHHAALQQG